MLDPDIARMMLRMLVLSILAVWHQVLLEWFSGCYLLSILAAGAQILLE